MTDLSFEELYTLQEEIVRLQSIYTLLSVTPTINRKTLNNTTAVESLVGFSTEALSQEGLLDTIKEKIVGFFKKIGNFFTSLFSWFGEKLNPFKKKLEAVEEMTKNPQLIDKALKTSKVVEVCPAVAVAKELGSFAKGEVIGMAQTVVISAIVTKKGRADAKALMAKGLEQVKQKTAPGLNVAKDAAANWAKAPLSYKKKTTLQAAGWTKDKVLEIFKYIKDLFKPGGFRNAMTAGKSLFGAASKAATRMGVSVWARLPGILMNVLKYLKVVYLGSWFGWIMTAFTVLTLVFKLYKAATGEQEDQDAADAAEETPSTTAPQATGA